MNFTLLLVFSLIAGVQTPASTPSSPWPPPGPARMEVSWDVRATPDEAAAEAGAIPFDTTISLGPPLVDSLLTGGGCTPGKFPQPTASRRFDESGSQFWATSRSKDGSSVSWSFSLKDNRITGEIVLRHVGTAVPRQFVEEVEQRKIGELSKREVRGVNGQVANVAMLMELEKEIKGGRNLPVAPGRTLRFLIATKPVGISARGDWPQGPTTRGAI